MPHVAALVVSAEVVAPPQGSVTAALHEESEVVLQWLESPGVRLVEIEGQWSLPIASALPVHAELD